MRRDLWPLKMLAAAAAILFGGIDIAVPGFQITPSILLLLGLMLIFDALNDRHMRVVEKQWAEEDSNAEARVDQAQAEWEGEQQAAIFRAGKELGFHIACHSSNQDLLKLTSLSPELRQKLEKKQLEIMAKTEELSRQFAHLNRRAES